MVKETTGVGDFIGSDGKPTSMKDHDVEMMLLAAAKQTMEATLQGMEFRIGGPVEESRKVRSRILRHGGGD
jgi:transcription antitermination factor NusG